MSFAEGKSELKSEPCLISFFNIESISRHVGESNPDLVVHLLAHFDTKLFRVIDIKIDCEKLQDHLLK